MTTSHPFRTVVALALLGALLGASFGVGGCTRLRRSQEVAIGNAKSFSAASGPLAVDVENSKGSVSIEVVEGSQPVVWAKASGSNGSNHNPDWVAASMASDGGHSVLRVLSTKPEGEARDTVLRIRVPSLAGVRVHNRGGLVSVVGVTGSIEVRNTLEFGSSPSIKVWAGGPITAPVDLVTDHGSVELRMHAASTGAMKAHTGKGVLRMECAKGNLAAVKANATDWSAVLNGGANPVNLRTEEGDVKLLLTTN
ncbi:MAG: hypothetical protein JSR77_06850 [Planctomycetes bacterium]|nr:hypothetical protein [Planctomycetota bacterium]